MSVSWSTLFQKLVEKKTVSSKRLHSGNRKQGLIPRKNCNQQKYSGKNGKWNDHVSNNQPDWADRVQYSENNAFICTTDPSN